MPPDRAVSSPTMTIAGDQLDPSTTAATPRRIRKPVIILGCARSATTMMGRILSRHPDIAFWSEPRPIWMTGNAYRRDDVLAADDLTPRIARRIDKRFGDFLEASGKSRFSEKTPSNCLRIPFIHALYPDCRIVNIIRDGRHVVRSILKIQTKGPNQGVLKRRLKETPLWEWPAYLPLFFNTMWRTRVLRKPSRYWGPRPKGWKQWVDLPRHLMVAKQWKAIVEATIRDGRALPEENYLELSYETLMARPVDTIQSVLDFAELSHADPVLDYTAEHIDPTRTHRWKQLLTPEQEREVQACLEPLLLELGYPLHDHTRNSVPGKQSPDR